MFAPAQPEDEKATPLEPGATVQVKMEANPHLHGKEATVESYDEGEKRYNIKMDEGGNVMSIRPENLEEIKMLKAGDLVKVTMPANPNLDGKTAAVESYDSKEKRYSVKMDEDGQSMTIRPENVMEIKLLQAGDVVKITMPSNSHLHGKIAVVEAWDGKEKRYSVKMQEGGGVMSIRPGNVEEMVEELLEEEVVVAFKLAPDAKVKVTMPNNPYLDGKTGVCVSFDEKDQRWNVKMDEEGNTASFRPETLADANPPAEKKAPRASTFVPAPKEPPKPPRASAFVQSGDASSKNKPLTPFEELSKRGIAAGTRVKIWSNSSGKWIEDGEVKEILTNVVRVTYNGGKTQKDVPIESAKDLLAKTMSL